MVQRMRFQRIETFTDGTSLWRGIEQFGLEGMVAVTHILRSKAAESLQERASSRLSVD